MPQCYRSRTSIAFPGREADRSMQPASEAWLSEPEHDDPVGTVRQLGDRGIERHEGALVTNGKCQQVRIGDLPVAGQPLERHFGRPCQIEVVRPESMSGASATSTFTSSSGVTSLRWRRGPSPG